MFIAPRRKFVVPLRTGSLILGERTAVMGVLNVTPDSFSDGGRFASVEVAVEHAFRMEKEGADIIDVGGESTRPGARSVGADEEIDRVVPVIERVAKRAKLPISVDTSKSAVACAALNAGACIINGITALQGDPEMAAAAAQGGAAVVLMHMKGTPRTMQQNPVYDDVVKEIIEFLRQAILRLPGEAFVGSFPPACGGTKETEDQGIRGSGNQGIRESGNPSSPPACGGTKGGSWPARLDAPHQPSPRAGREQERQRLDATVAYKRDVCPKDAEASDMRQTRILIDPGIGFGKTTAHNLEIMARLDEFAALSCPIVIGTSRKSFIGIVLNLPVGERLEGTAATVAAAILGGAHVVRVHDVLQMRRVADVCDAIRATHISMGQQPRER